MKQFLKNILFFTLHALNPNLGNSASILMYHSIGGNGCFFSVTKGAFERQMRYLSERKFNVVSLGELICRLKNGKSIAGCIALTFDDGYRDNYDAVFPILKKYNFPATIFITTDFIGKSFKNSEGASFEMLSEEMIREMSASGFIEFMPHTMSHRVLEGLPEAVMREEIKGSRAYLESITKSKADIFSYPKGKCTKEAVSYLKKSGWRGAVTVREGLISSNENLFLLKRNSIDSSTTFTQFMGKISRAIDIYCRLKRWLK